MCRFGGRRPRGSGEVQVSCLLRHPEPLRWSLVTQPTKAAASLKTRLATASHLNYICDILSTSGASASMEHAHAIESKQTGPEVSLFVLKHLYSLSCALLDAPVSLLVITTAELSLRLDILSSYVDSTNSIYLQSPVMTQEQQS